ncbi:hypothetical protein [Virgibacillus siamensis]|uniref:hypothetical protein n=1 Tax=Virgibacillus siamensis TaxID=480071 RepID=UPI00098770CA|nr:hypothetical protein [Virgibacillus siamensis]
MKQTIRSFALGLLVAGIVILATFYFSEDTRQASQKLSTDEMIASIEEEGYHVLDESEYISFSVKSDNSRSEEEKSNEDTKKSSEKSSKENEQNEQKNKDNDNTSDKENSKNDKNKSSNDNDSKDKKNDSDKEKPAAYTLKVKSGMPPSVISDKLAKHNIIKDADKFVQYMENYDYISKVQLGTFKFTSDMSNYEIAEELTN